IPDYFPSWGEYENFVKLLIKTNCIDNAKKIWWDIRPHPFFDTLEFRVCDIPMRVDETIALAALIQATIVKLYKLHAANQGFRLGRHCRSDLGEKRCMNLPVSQTNQQLSRLSFDPELTPGARNAVNVCLRVQPSEKVTVITDEATKEIAAAIIHELENVGSPY